MVDIRGVYEQLLMHNYRWGIVVVIHNRVKQNKEYVHMSDMTVAQHTTSNNSMLPFTKIISNGSLVEAFTLEEKLCNVFSSIAKQTMLY